MWCFNLFFLLLGSSALPYLTNANPLPEVRPRDVSESKVVKMPLTKRYSSSNLVKRHGETGSGHGPFSVPLSNDIFSYEIACYVGTPKQLVSLQIDTGSSDLWVLGPGACPAANCICPDEGCTIFDPSQSTTARSYEDATFHFSYGSGEVAGEYITDDVYVGEASIKDIIIGVGLDDIDEPRGIMGIGLRATEVIKTIPEHPGVIDLLYTEGWISTHSYSLYLDDAEAKTGAIIFGGYDSSKWVGDLVSLPIQPSPDGLARLMVEWTSLDLYIEGESPTSASLTTASLPNATLLDSGSTLAYIPLDILDAMSNVLPLAQADDGTVLCDCALAATPGHLEFGFGDGPAVKISVAISEIVRSPVDDTGSVCTFGFQPNGGDIDILGDTFLRSAYVYYDFDAYTISLAQAKFE